MQDYSLYSDTQLMLLVRKENSDSAHAFNTIYFRYTSQLYGYCLYKSGTREEAQEIFQDTWLKFFYAVKSGKKINNILPYLFSIAKNASIDKYRSNSSKKYSNIKYIDIDDFERFADPINLHNELEKDEFDNLVKIAVNQLDDIYREVITLYWFGNLDYNEIAAICGENESCVRTRLARAFKHLAVFLKPYVIETN